MSAIPSAAVTGAGSGTATPVTEKRAIEPVGDGNAL
jgi:hypothetical protein